jgi:5-methylcytosine-specific restriction endonuclease McrA
MTVCASSDCNEAVARRVDAQYCSLRCANREASRRWRAANPDKHRERTRAWTADNRDKANASVKRYAAAHPDRILEQQRRWQAANPGKSAAKSRRWRMVHKDQHREQAARVRASLRCEHPECLSVGVLPLVWRTQPHFCYLCGIALSLTEARYAPGAAQFDHVVPLSKGGVHCVLNVRPACAACNMHKGARLLAA